MDIRNILKFMKISSRKINKIVLSALICTSAFVLFVNVNNKIDKINKEENIKASHIFANINKKIQFIISTLYSLKFDDRFNEFIAESSNGKDNQYLKSVLQRKIVTGSTIYGNMGYLLNFSTSSIDYYISARGIESKEYFYKSNNFLPEIENKSKSVSSDSNYINLFYNDRGYLGINSSFWVINIDKDLFFFDISQEESKNWYLGIDDIVSFSVKGNKETARTIGKIKEIGKKAHIVKEVMRIDGRLLHVFYLPDIEAELYYYQPRARIFLITALEMLKVIALSVMVYLILAILINSVKKPLSELAERIGYRNGNKMEEISYIETRFEELNSTNFELTDRVNELSKIQKTKSLKDILLGLLTVNEIHRASWEKDYRIVLLEIYDTDFMENIYSNFSITEEIVKRYFSDETMFELINIDFKSMVIIIGNINQDEISGIINNLISNIENSFSLYFVAAVTDGLNKMEKLSYGYRVAKKIMEYKYIYRQHKVIFQNMINKESFNKYHYPIQLEAKLISKVMGANINEVNKVIKEIFRDDTEKKLIDRKELREFSALLYNTLNRIIIQLNEMNIGNINLREKIENILKVKHKNELKDVFIEIISEICKFIKENSEIDLRRIKESIERYMLENYMKDISLESLSDYLGYSFKYTGILFKKIMGDNFKNYLSLYRIGKAKSLMLEREYRIKELAEMVGYSSSNTFIRMFRKYEGVSPGKYFSDENENS